MDNWMILAWLFGAAIAVLALYVVIRLAVTHALRTYNAPPKPKPSGESLPPWNATAPN